MGILAYELLTGVSPWTAIENKEALKQEIKSKRVTLPASVTPSVTQFIEMLLRKDARDRLGTRSDADVKGAPFFCSIDWAKTAALECPPALTPPAISVTDEDAVNASRRYTDMSIIDKLPGTAAAFWMGLQVADSFPVELRE